MAAFSALAIGLSFLFGCIFLGIVGELYYVLWWKKRIANREIDDRYTTIKSEISYTFCWKKSNSTNVNITNVHQHQELAATVRNSEAINRDEEQDLELGEESVESELMKLHNLYGPGPPRFLFTINEETKEDLESEDGKSKRGSRTRSLSDLIITVDTPFLTPLSSPPVKSHVLDSYNQLGFNPLFESFSEAEFTRLRSSPPPKFKFLRDAEEKLMRRIMEETEKRVLKNGGNIQDSCVVKASSIPSMVNEEKYDSSLFSFKGREQLHHQLPFCHSATSQVFPLASSPSTFRPFDNKQAVQ